MLPDANSVTRRQTLVQLNDALLAALDQHVAATGRSRSDLIREAIEHYLSESSDVDTRIVEGYRRTPQTTDTWVETLALQSIADEPW